MIIGKSIFYFNVMNLFISIILLLGIFQFFRYILLKLKPNSQKITFIKSFTYLIFCIIISSIRTIPLSFFPIIFAIYMLLNGIINFITYFLMLLSKVNGKFLYFIMGIIYFLMGVPLLFAPLKNITTMLLIVGVYAILLGINFFFTFLSNILPVKAKKVLKRKFRLTLPAIFEAIIPYQVLKEINYYWNRDNFDYPLVIKENKTYIKPDLEVFIHIAPSSYNRFGHVDICIDNTVISYGAYDETTSKFFNMIGEGTIFKVDRDKYIDYCTNYSNKTLFCYGLHLNEKQIKNINKQIDYLMDNVVKFQSQYEIDKLNKEVKLEYKDYPSKLAKRTSAKFYKVTSGQFKTFFILSVNCCKLADYIIGKGGSDLLKMTGIITPGTYYEYLNQEFYKKNSMVISRTIYNNHSLTKKKDSII